MRGSSLFIRHSSQHSTHRSFLLVSNHPYLFFHFLFCYNLLKTQEVFYKLRTKQKKQNSGLTLSSNTKPVDKRVNNGVQKTISLYLRWDIGPADLLKKIRHLNLNRIWSLPDCHLNGKLPESFSLKKLHRCVFLSQTVSVLKYLIPADRN